MKMEKIEKAMKEAVHEYYSCYDYQCEGRDCCEFCNGQHSASYSKESCKADDFGEGFYYGAEWRINSVWHDMSEKPNGMFAILIDFGGDFEEYSLGINLDGAETAKRWAYISDLTPRKNKNSF